MEERKKNEAGETQERGLGAGRARVFISLSFQATLFIFVEIQKGR
jgi:hypothetical protein